VLLFMLVGCSSGPSILSRERAVINGTLYTNPAIPYIWLQYATYREGCTGAFISPHLILTAAHCAQYADITSALAFDGDENADTFHTGKEYTIKPSMLNPPQNRMHVPTQWAFGEPFPDVAIMETVEAFEGTPLEIATGSALPQPSNIGSFADQTVTVVGFSPNNGSNRRRLTGTMLALGTGGTYITNAHDGAPGISYQGFTLVPGPNTTCNGDSGGPVLLNGKIIGVTSSGNCGLGATDYQHTAYIVPELLAYVDADSDGVGIGLDNCPTTPNADQTNCNAVSESQPLGDACDPNPCVYAGGVNGFNESTGPVSYLRNALVRVHYRGTGFGGQNCTGPDCRRENADAMVCACHMFDVQHTDPHNPILVDPEICAGTICRPTDLLVTNDYNTATGYLPLLWSKAYDDNPAPPYYNNPQQCSLQDINGDGRVNECNQAIPNRLFVKPFSGTSGLGKNPGDMEAFWLAGNNTRLFDWSWRQQDYPHPTAVPYIPPTNYARLRVWMRPVSYHPLDPQGGPVENQNNATSVLDLTAETRLRELLLLTLLNTETSILPDPIERAPVFGLGDPPDLLLVRPLGLGRSEPEAEPYFWPTRPEGTLTKGLVLARVNPHTGEISGAMRSQVLQGDPLFTADFATARWPATDGLYVFGGATQRQTYPSKLWYATPTQSQGQTIYQWREVATHNPPPGRAGAMLIADATRNRLLLIGGRNGAGVRREGFALDLSALTWSSINMTQLALPGVESAAYSYDGSKLYVYGGKDTRQYYELLTEVDLATLTGRRIDSGTTPGVRAGAAMRYLPSAGNIYLFGGQNSQARNDLWRFNLTLRVWERLSAQGAPGAAPAMPRAALALSRRDGGLVVLGGQASSGCGQPLWRFRAGIWKTYEQLMQVE